MKALLVKWLDCCDISVSLKEERFKSAGGVRRVCSWHNVQSSIARWADSPMVGGNRSRNPLCRGKSKVGWWLGLDRGIEQGTTLGGRMILYRRRTNIVIWSWTSIIFRYRALRHGTRLLAATVKVSNMITTCVWVCDVMVALGVWAKNPKTWGSARTAGYVHNVTRLLDRIIA